MSRDGFVSPQELAGFPKETAVLLAFSGGADSCALLHLLAESAAADGFALTLAHVNHGIRGEEALRDRDFCQKWAAAYGLEICVLDADVPALAKESGRSLEETARAVRYDYFERLMRERGIPLLATAHHADDNLETVLFHLCRGTGLSGLGGIAPVRPFRTGMLTRPLLGLSRREILDYCEENRLEYVTDSTNADPVYARNRIRARVVPILGELYENLPQRTVRMTEGLREDEAFLAQLAHELLEKAENGYGLSLDLISKAANPIRTRALMEWIGRETGHTPERVHIEGVLSLFDGRHQGAEIALPADFCAAVEFGSFCIYPRQRGEAKPLRLPLTEGEWCSEDLGFAIFVKKIEENTKINNLSTESYINLNINFDIMKDNLFWRTYREGDTLLRGGMHKKLRKLYGEANVPVRWRTRLPLLCDGEGIVWAPFVGARDGFKTNDPTHRIGVRIIAKRRKE